MSSKKRKATVEVELDSEDIDEEADASASFRRILDENEDGTQVLLEWCDGAPNSWCDRVHLEGTPALEMWDYREEEGEEIRMPQREVVAACATLAKWMRDCPSKRIVWHIGAGFSAADGVPTFRGVGGLWTAGRPADLSQFDLSTVVPGDVYQCMLALEREGYVYWVISQNYDGLFIKSGFPEAKLSEIHGNIFREKCLKCLKQFYRDFVVEDEDAEDHLTGRQCENCHGDLVDCIVHFDEQLRGVSLANAKSKGAEISIAIGTKLNVTPAATWVFRPHQKVRNKGRVAVVNLQETPEDSRADVVIHHEAVVFLTELLRQLEIEI